MCGVAINKKKSKIVGVKLISRITVNTKNYLIELHLVAQGRFCKSGSLYYIFLVCEEGRTGGGGGWWDQETKCRPSETSAHGPPGPGGLPMIYKVNRHVPL